MAQRPGLGADEQPPLPLIQMREDRLELRRQYLSGYLHDANTTPPRAIPGVYGLFFCGPLTPRHCVAARSLRAPGPRLLARIQSGAYRRDARV